MSRALSLGLPGGCSSWLFCLYFLIKSIRTAWCPIFFTSCWTIRSLSARRAAPLTSSSGKKKKKSPHACLVKHCKRQHTPSKKISFSKGSSKLVLSYYKIICISDRQNTDVHNTKSISAPKKELEHGVTIKSYYFHITASPLPILSYWQVFIRKQILGDYY